MPKLQGTRNWLLSFHTFREKHFQCSFRALCSILLLKRLMGWVPYRLIFWVLFMIATVPDHGVNLFPGSTTLCKDTCQGLPLCRQQILHLQNHLGQLLKAEKPISTSPLTSPSSLLNLHSSIHLSERPLSYLARIQDTRVNENISPAFPGGTRPF